MRKKMSKDKFNKRHIEEVVETDDAYTIRFAKYQESDDSMDEMEVEVEASNDPKEQVERLMEVDTDNKKISEKTKVRAYFPLELRADDYGEEAGEEEDRMLSFSVSSESPVQREFGLEVLGHRQSDNVRLDRLNNGAPLLLNHDANSLVGIVESATLDVGRGRLMATVRLGRSTLAEETYRDIQDGIRRNISIGYQINQMERQDDGDVVRVTDWEAFEISLVSIPADSTIGIGRNLGRSLSLIEQANTESNMSEIKTEEVKAPSIDQGIDVEAAVKTRLSEEMKLRNKEISEILNLGAAHNRSDLAKASINSGERLDVFRGKLLNEIENQPLENTEIGLTKDETRQFSIMRAVRALSNPTDRRAQEEASFEFEASRAYGEMVGKTSEGIFVPSEIQNQWSTQERVINTTTGLPLVYSELQYNNLIEALTPWSTVLASNPTTLQNLQGNVSIPRITAIQTAAFVAEGANVADQTETLDSVTLSQKTLGASTLITRSMMMNSDNFSVEQMVRNNLAQAISVGFDNAALNGTGVAPNPRGIINTVGIGAQAFAAAGVPTWQEILAMESTVYQANSYLGPNTRLITTGAVQGSMKGTPKVAGAGASSFVQQDGFVNGYEVLISSQVPAGNIVFGDFTQFIAAFWGGLELLADPYTNSSSGTLKLVAMSSIDFGVRHPASFVLGQ